MHLYIFTRNPDSKEYTFTNSKGNVYSQWVQQIMVEALHYLLKIDGNIKLS